jgi:hypothetical protein
MWLGGWYSRFRLQAGLAATRREGQAEENVSNGAYITITDNQVTSQLHGFHS